MWRPCHVCGRRCCRSPLCLLREVHLAVFRAYYQVFAGCGPAACEARGLLQSLATPRSCRRRCRLTALLAPAARPPPGSLGSRSTHPATSASRRDRRPGAWRRRPSSTRWQLRVRPQRPLPRALSDTCLVAHLVCALLVPLSDPLLQSRGEMLVGWLTNNLRGRHPVAHPLFPHAHTHTHTTPPLSLQCRRGATLPAARRPPLGALPARQPARQATAAAGGHAGGRVGVMLGSDRLWVCAGSRRGVKILRTPRTFQ
jgi:hypothetical protein